MDQLSMAFGPISDVSAFSHRDGRTFLEIQEELRDKLNTLAASQKNLAQHVESRNGDVALTFETYQNNIAGLITEIEQLRDELGPYVTQSTNYVTE